MALFGGRRLAPLSSHEMVDCPTHAQCLCVALIDLMGKVNWCGQRTRTSVFICGRLPPTHLCGRTFRARTVHSTVPLHPSATPLHDKNQDRQTSRADNLKFHHIKMIHTIFDHLLSCRDCDSPILVVGDLTASCSTKATGAGNRVGLVIRHGTRESAASTSSLQFFPFEAAEPLPQWGTEESSTIFRHVIYMEECTAPESRRQISQKWGLRWLNFEQHFETIAAFSMSKVGECLCKCHQLDNSADDVSVDTTLALVGQQSGRHVKDFKDPETKHGSPLPADIPSELRGRAQSEEILPTDVFILTWREQCRRESC